jgi:two-component system, OmpR family, heavy metal sensor histidine kinase CusS
MNSMLDRLQDSFERLYNSARNLSHKIRTPLTILKGEAEVALSRNRSVDELEQVILSSLEENNRLVRLVENILFLATAEMGRFQTEPVPLDVRSEIEKVVDFYTPFAEEKEISIDCQGDAQILADPTQFRKGIAALLSNALIYSEPGATVTFTVRQAQGLSGEIEVRDSGCGIAESEHEKVLDRFYRIYATRFMDPHGTGLGLPIVKAIMDLHHGDFQIASVPGRGTCVTLRFPGAALQRTSAPPSA